MYAIWRPSFTYLGDNSIEAVNMGIVGAYFCNLDIIKYKELRNSGVK